MDAPAIVAFVNRHFYDIQIIKAPGGWFFCFGPYADKNPWTMVPFASLLTDTQRDDNSQPNKPDNFRLNIGTRRGVYNAIYGQGSGLDPERKPLIQDFDYTRIKAATPDPISAQLAWVCIQNPTDEEFERCTDLLSNAYRFAVTQHNELIERYPEGWI
jgi:hypothetical protein